MATVYLPFGYPRISGAQFENVIYQGDVARLYVVQRDPRSDAQLSSRRLLSDVAKMRGKLDIWGRSACNAAFGSRWANVIYQLIRADDEGWWDGAMSAWGGFSSQGRDAWRAAAPYQATYNDVGKIFFGLSRWLYHAINHFSGSMWGIEAWGETGSASALEWWNRIDGDILAAGWNEDDSAMITIEGLSTEESAFEARGGKYLRIYNSYSFYFFGRSVTWYALVGPTFGNADVYLDGRLYGVCPYNQVVEFWGDIYKVETKYKGFHHVRVDVVSSSAPLDGLFVR